MTEFEYSRFGHVNGELTPWVMRAACASCSWATEWERQPGSDSLKQSRAEHEATHSQDRAP